MTSDTQPTNTPGRSAALLPVVLLIVVLLLGLLMLMALGFKESPMLSAAFVIVLLTVVIGGAIAWVRDSRGRGRAHSEQLSTVHTTVAQASAQAFATTTTALFEYLKQNQLAPPSYIPALPAPARDQIVDVPKIMNMNQPVGVSGVRTQRANGQPEVVASVAGLSAALNILALGQEPTRSNFREQGIASSMEAAGAVEFLAHHGYIEQRGQGAPTLWSATVSPADVPAIADHLRAYAPALPRFIPIETPQNLDLTLVGAGRQAGGQAGKRGRK